MRRIENLVREMYRDGHITFSEAAALIGAVDLVAEEWNNNTELFQQWQTSYGTFSVEAIAQLVAEEKE